MRLRRAICLKVFSRYFSNVPKMPLGLCYNGNRCNSRSQYMQMVVEKNKDFLKEVDSISLQQALRHLDNAYQNFFQDKKVGFPKFKSRKNHHFYYSTVCVNNNIRLEDGYLILPKVRAVKIKQHRTAPKGYLLKSATISKTPTDKYFVSILYEYEAEIMKVDPVTSIGIVDRFLIGIVELLGHF